MGDRFEPYTRAGLRNVPCTRCGTKPSYAQFNLCADKVGDKVRFRPLCWRCDVSLNKLAMEFMLGKTAWSAVCDYESFVIGDAMSREPKRRPPQPTGSKG